MASYDLMIVDSVDGEVEFYFSNKLINGISKLVQIFYVMLLTAFQSKAIDPSDGNDLITVIKNTNVSEGAVMHSVNIAVESIARKMIEENSSVTNPDEQLKSLKVLEIKKTGRSLVVNTEIVSQSTKKVEVQIPISIYSGV